ncbi:MAG: hypothetical protein AAF802_04060 [Planctomycetota bacterium]
MLHFVRSMLFATWMVGVSSCWAEFRELVDSTQTIQFPNGTTNVATGLAATVKFDVTMTPGTVGVKATVRSTVGPSTRQRLLTLRVTPIDLHVNGRHAVESRFALVLEQGKQSVTLSKSFPKWSFGDAYRIELLEDGDVIPGFVNEAGGTLRPSMLVSAPGLMTNELINIAVEVVPERQTESDLKIFRLTFEDVPTDWRLLRNVNSILIQYSALSELVGASEFSARADAIKNWTAMGGLLVVLGTPSFDELSEKLEMTLISDSDDRKQFVQRTTAIKTAWLNRLRQYEYFKENPGASSSYGTGLLPPELGGRLTPDPTQFINDPTWVENLSEDVETLRQEIRDFDTAWGKGFSSRAGLGLVVGLPTSIGNDLGPGVVQNLVADRISPMLLRGVDPVLGDARFRRWLIPGVAQPPVYTFIGILTLFVILVGPVAYRWTSRGHRSHLMFAIAPFLALMTTVAMFAYGIVADGFGTIARVRQVTWIDGMSGDAVERTRVTLFAGLTPREPLRFDEDAEVMLYPNNVGTEWDDLPSDVPLANRFRVAVNEEDQLVDPSVLPARAQTQFVSHQVRRGIGSIGFSSLPEFNADENAPTEAAVISNQLPFEMTRVVVRSRDGRYWSVDRLPSKAEQEAKPLPKIQEVSRLLGSLYNDHRPISVASRSKRTNRNTNAVTDLIVTVNRQMGRTSAIQDGCFETLLSNSLSVSGELDPGTFVGFAAPSDDSLPVDEAEHVASVRYVMGTIR